MRGKQELRYLNKTLWTSNPAASEPALLYDGELAQCSMYLCVRMRMSMSCPTSVICSPHTKVMRDAHLSSFQAVSSPKGRTTAVPPREDTNSLVPNAGLGGDKIHCKGIALVA